MNKAWLFIKSHPWWTLIFLFAAVYYGHMAFMAAGRHHFKTHCEHDAGEFIYKTVDNVEGIFQMRPREPLYYFDTLRHYRQGRGELMEDPYGHTNIEGQDPWVLFVRHEGKFRRSFYQYLETSKAPNMADHRYPKLKIMQGDKVEDLGHPYWIYRALPQADQNKETTYTVKNIAQLQSRYGFTWRQVQSPWDKLFGIYGGETLVKDLKTNETLALKRGYVSLDFGICPLGKESFFMNDFITQVLKPVNVTASHIQ